MHRLMVCIIAGLAVALTTAATAGAMLGQFNSPESLKGSGQVVKVTGPYALDSDESSAVVQASISQGNCTAVGTSDPVSGSGTWAATATAKGCRLVPGPATATAVATIQEANGGSETYVWTQSISVN